MQGKRLFIARVMTCKTQEEAQAFRNLRLMMLREEFEGEQDDDDEDSYPAEDLIGLQVSVLSASMQALPCIGPSLCSLHAQVPCKRTSLCWLHAQAAFAMQVHMLLHPEGQPELIGHVISIHEGMGTAPLVQLSHTPSWLLGSFSACVCPIRPHNGTLVSIVQPCAAACTTRHRKLDSTGAEHPGREKCRDV